MSRSTKDVDLAVAAPIEDLPGLLELGGWRRDRAIRHRWYSAEGTPADILPVTPDLIEAGEVSFGDGLIMSLVGFDLVLRHTTHEEIPGTGMRIEVAELPVLVLLKMVAWLDRPSERSRDLEDLATILDHALADEDERRWDLDHPVGESGLHHEDQGAYFVGLEVGRIIQDHHRAPINRFLEKVGDPDSIWFAQMVQKARYVGVKPDEILERRWAAFRRGLNSL